MTSSRNPTPGLWPMVAASALAAPGLPGAIGGAFVVGAGLDTPSRGRKAG